MRGIETSMFGIDRNNIAAFLLTSSKQVEEASEHAEGPDLMVAMMRLTN